MNRSRFALRSSTWLAAWLACFAVSCVASGGFEGNPELLDSTKQDATTIVVMRASQFAGGGVNMPLELDGTVVAHLGIGECVRLYLPAGEHFVLMGEGTRSQLQKFTSSPGEIVYLKFEVFTLDTERQWHFDRLSEETGAKEFATGDYDLIGER